MRRAGSAVLLTLLALVSGCAGLPEDGPVRTGEPQEELPSAAPFDFNPPGPKPDASQVEVISGFLLALQGTPSSTSVASEFLTAESVPQWKPDLRTLVHQGQVLEPDGDRVTVGLDGAFALDRNGRWDSESRVTRRGKARLPFDLVREDGEWRITDPPDATIIPAAHFAARYREYSLYFFDVTGSVLVPEPVYLPWGVQAPTRLVRGLLTGPQGRAALVERSFIPRGTQLGVAVPVSDTGVAEVPLSAPVAALDDEQLELVLAQLAWTLRQASEVSGFRITVDGATVDVPGGDVTEVDGWGEYAPWVPDADDDLFGLRGRRVVQRVGTTQIEAAKVGEPGDPRPRSVGVSFSGRRFAVVSADGASVTALSRSGEEEPAEVVYEGSDVAQPAWDRTERLWLVDRRSGGSRILVSDPLRPDRLRTLEAPGLAGTRLTAVALARDGTRLVALAQDRGAPRLVVSRVVRDQGGRPLRLASPREVAVPGDLSGARDLGWRDPTTLAVLRQASSTTSEVLLASVDGSSGRIDLDSAVDVLFDTVTSMAASSAPPAALLVATPSGAVHALDPQGRWDLDAVEPAMRAPTFVG